MSNLILIRHGQSVWNLQNRFTGWYDVALSDNGLLEANKAGVLLKKLHIKIEFAYTSYLRRAIQTLEIILNNEDNLTVADINSDGAINVVDIVILVGWILSDN